jgi:hypothetical protein
LTCPCRSPEHRLIKSPWCQLTLLTRPPQVVALTTEDYRLSEFWVHNCEGKNKHRDFLRLSLKCKKKHLINGLCSWQIFRRISEGREKCHGHDLTFMTSLDRSVAKRKT